jgi:hypothetical protein
MPSYAFVCWNRYLDIADAMGEDTSSTYSPFSLIPQLLYVPWLFVPARGH